MHDIHKATFHQRYFFAFIVCYISGFSDMFGFIALNKLFTAHITGNIVILIYFIVSHQAGFLSKLLAIPIFMIVAAFITVIVEHTGLNKKYFGLWFIGEFFLFLLFFVSGIFVFPGLPEGSLMYVVICMFPILAMSIHNTILKLYLPQLPPSAVMTVNFISFITHGTRYLLHFKRRSASKKRTILSSFKTYANVVGGFSVGGLMSAVSYIYVGFYALIFILLALFVSVAMIYFYDIKR